ncbi:hypothetical protein [Amycolatopsis sp. NPDC059021]|uniref:hypothetical protein n=1 Tax=Amycolatopsis sp. NPDC059021 TaxID=3346704 RepID=UPI0036717A2C
MGERLDWRLIWWVNTGKALHALAREVPRGVAATRHALCGEQVRVVVRPWLVVPGPVPIRECPACRAKVNAARPERTSRLGFPS